MNAIKCFSLSLYEIVTEHHFNIISNATAKVTQHQGRNGKLGKVEVKLSLCLIKLSAMERYGYGGVEV
jgi:hypothetical protein